jgi:hypothetical protein
MFPSPNRLKDNPINRLSGVFSVLSLGGKAGPRCCRCLALAVLASFFLFLVPNRLSAQATETERPVPILSGSAGYFNFVTGGQNLIDTQVNPVLLVPLGDHWLVESRAEFEGQFQRPPGGGPYGGPVDKHLDYAQVDYIASPYVTVTAGRFLTPFGIFNERLYPIWIRALQFDPLILGIGTAASDGAMLRGGFPVNATANMNYAVYFSAASIGVTGVESERHVGGRIGFFLPGPRLEVGGSWQKTLQDTRKNAFGFHMGWQPTKVPLSMHAEFARSFYGTGYWVEGAYRLSQVHFWQKAMRRTELVGRGQQFFNGPAGWNVAQQWNLPVANTREGEFGINYFLRDGLKGAASYGRQFSSWGNANVWSVGIAYRFLIPLGWVGAP